MDTCDSYVFFLACVFLILDPGDSGDWSFDVSDIMFSVRICSVLFFSVSVNLIIAIGLVTIIWNL